jgi:hypothetical protein
MERLTRIQRQRAQRDGMKIIAGLLLAVVVFGFIAWRLHSENKGYKYGEYNHHVCVEVYGLNEDCK